MIKEKLVELFEIIEYRDNSIYKTKSAGEHWVDFNTPYYTMINKDGKEYQVCVLSSKRQSELGMKKQYR